jgi:2-haloalkanoic acid dehalogenase type II
MKIPAPLRAVMFDLLTGLVDSWSLWNDVAGGEAAGRAWRAEYLRLTYGQGAYRPYEAIVADAARMAGLDVALAGQLSARWGELQPWPEASRVLAELRGRGLRLAVATNCSEVMGHAAAAVVGVPFDVVVTAERAGFYKPRPEPYRFALAELGHEAQQVLFLAGSPSDIAGAHGTGMPVVWHNRIGLPRPASTPGLVAETRSLADLLDLTTAP